MGGKIYKKNKQCSRYKNTENFHYTKRSQKYRGRLHHLSKTDSRADQRNGYNGK